MKANRADSGQDKETQRPRQREIWKGGQATLTRGCMRPSLPVPSHGCNYSVPDALTPVLGVTPAPA